MKGQAERIRPVVRNPEAPIPLVARLGGLAADSLDGFGSGELDELLARLDGLEIDLSRHRGSLAERIYELVPERQPRDRRRLLAIRRDLHNDRPLARHRTKPHWSELQAWLGDEAEEVLRLERERDRILSRLEADYDEALLRERRSLLEWLQEPSFRHGLAVASPSLESNLPRLERCPAESFGRKERGLEISLLRYASRAALKLSPFSTLTRLCIAVVEDAAEGAPPEVPRPFCRLAAGEQTRTLVRCAWLQLLEIIRVLIDVPVFRAALPVRCNRSCRRVGDRWSFVRPGQLEPRDDDDGFRFRAPALVQLKLPSAVTDWLLRTASAPRPFGEVHALASQAFEEQSGEALEQLLDKLLELGFLTFEFPWTADDPHLDRQLLRFLEASAIPELEGVTAAVRRVTELVAGESVDRPDRREEKCREALATAFHQALGLGHRPDDPSRGDVRHTVLHEDVFVLPETHPSLDAALLEVSRDKMERLNAAARPLVRLATVLNRQYDFLLNLAELAADQWPGRETLPFLDVLPGSQDLWQDYVEFELDVRAGRQTKMDAFNPRGSAPVEEIRSHRKRLLTGLVDHLERREDGWELDVGGLDASLDEVPEPFATPRDTALFVQPIDPAGRRWVLNEIFEGVRYTCRYLSQMDGRVLDRFVAQLRSRARLEGDVEWVEVVCSGRRGMNVHPVMTPRVLEIPGERSSLPESQRLALTDLRVVFPGRGELPYLIAPEGHRVVPVYLGTIILHHMPILLKFLSQFGLLLSEAVVPDAPAQRRDGIRVFDRVSAGDLVLRRKRWVVEKDSLLQAVADRSDREAYLSLNRWRRERNLPARLFQARRYGFIVDKPHYKPQFLDFTSPLFARLHLAALQEMDDPYLVLEEALPAPENAVVDAAGRPWLCELQLESLALHRRPLSAAHCGLSEAPLAARLGGAA